MNKSGLLFIIVSAIITLAGCSSNKPTNIPLESAANTCTASIHSASLEKNGKTTLKALRKIDSLYVQVGGSTEKTRLIEELPYVESDGLDNGVPGSAWRQCMQEKGFTIGPKN